MWLLFVISCCISLAFAKKNQFNKVNSSEGIVLLWSHGRSGSSTLGATIAQNLNLQYCNGAEEAFSVVVLTANSLRNCSQSGGIRFVQVKPKHIPGVNPQCIECSQSLIKIHDFFSMAKDNGVRYVITNRRQNALAALISSVERNRADQITDYQFKRVYLRNFYVFLEVGYLQSLILGFPTMETDFGEVTTAPCNITMRLHNSLTNHWPGYDVTPPPTLSSCAIVNRQVHVNETGLHEPYEARVPPIVYQHIVHELKGTPYEWMLDPDAMSWPATDAQKNPCEIISHCLTHHSNTTIADHLGWTN